MDGEIQTHAESVLDSIGWSDSRIWIGIGAFEILAAWIPPMNVNDLLGHVTAMIPGLGFVLIGIINSRGKVQAAKEQARLQRLEIENRLIIEKLKMGLLCSEQCRLQKQI